MAAQKNAKTATAQDQVVNPLAALLPEKTLKKTKSTCEIIAKMDVVVYRRSDNFQLGYVQGTGKIVVSQESKAPEDQLFGGLAPTQDPAALFEALTSAGYSL